MSTNTTNGARVTDMDAAVYGRSRRHRCRSARRCRARARSSPVRESRMLSRRSPDRLLQRGGCPPRQATAPTSSGPRGRPVSASRACRSGISRAPQLVHQLPRPRLVQVVGIIGCASRRAPAAGACSGGSSTHSTGRRPRPGCARRAAPGAISTTVSGGVPGGHHGSARRAARRREAPRCRVESDAQLAEIEPHVAARDPRRAGTGLDQLVQREQVAGPGGRDQAELVHDRLGRVAGRRAARRSTRQPRACSACRARR